MNRLVARATSLFLCSSCASEHGTYHQSFSHSFRSRFLFLSLLLFFTDSSCRFGHFAKMKIIQRYRRAILAPVSIVILLCGCTDLVSSRSPRFAEHPKNDTDFVSVDCERVKPFFESKNITILVDRKQATAEDIAKSK